MARRRFSYATNRFEPDPVRTCEVRGQTVVVNVVPAKDPRESMKMLLSKAAKVAAKNPPHRFYAKLDLANENSYKVAIELQRMGVNGADIEWFDSSQ